MIWLMTKNAEDGSVIQSEQFLQVDGQNLEIAALRFPENEALFHRLNTVDFFVSPEDINGLHVVFESLWDRVQGNLVEEILKAGGLPKERSLKARHLARDLKKGMQGDAFMLALEEILAFLNLVREEQGGLQVVS